jgi:LysM repeat protein
VLAEANGITNYGLIYTGQKLVVPDEADNATSAAAVATESQANSANESAAETSGGEYVVKPGETLWQIAARYNLLTAALAKANGITDPSKVYAGQRLTIPGHAVAANVDSTSAATNTAAPTTSQATAARTVNAGPNSIVANKRIVAYYGNPLAGSMGILGRYDAGTMIAKLKSQAAEYALLSRKPIQPALEFITPVAQASAGADGLYRLRMSMDLIEQWADIAVRNGSLFILDVQVGRGKVQDEVNVLLPLLKRPNVHLALDPEFDMWENQLPGQQIGHMTAQEINWATRTLSNLAAEGAGHKILIVHQFTPNMLPDKTSIVTDPNVDIVIDMDGFGGQGGKIGKYDDVQSTPVQFAGIKLFYREDTDLLTPGQLMELDPVPDVIIYQ